MPWRSKKAVMVSYASASLEEFVWSSAGKSGDVSSAVVKMAVNDEICVLAASANPT